MGSRSADQLDSSDGETRIRIDQYVCKYAKCKKTSLSIVRHTVRWDNGHRYLGKILQRWELLPSSSAKPQPDYIPAQIISDYQEACAILKLSPKASATISRRCLQGMVRDVFKAEGKSLWAELESVKEKMDETTWSAIQAYREVGNIGAHMEKDVNVIIEVDEGEAELLINLTEQLFKDWYVARHERQIRLERAIELTSRKRAEKLAAKPASSGNGS